MMYSVNLNSRFVCFALNEPIDLLALGANPGVAALTAIQPSFPSQGSSITLFPDPNTGTAQLTLEVLSSAVGPAGLDLKAVWPAEGVESLANVISPTSTAPTAAGTPAATGTAVPVVAGTGTPQPNPGVPTAFTLRACVDPNPVSPGGGATLYAQTIPGATCTASDIDPEGTPTDFNGGSQVALADGLVIYPFTAGQTPGVGTSVVACNYKGQNLRTTTTYTIAAPGTAGPTATAVGLQCYVLGDPCPFRAGAPPPTPSCPLPPRTGNNGLYVDVCVQPPVQTFNTQVTIFARTLPGAVCTPQVTYTNGNQPSSLDTSPKTADSSGLVGFGFLQQTFASGGTATVSCQLGVEVAQGSADFVVTL
ncbi:MAG: hypothetical protein ACR2JC_11455 [Chloroflexota bacterium]